MRLLTNNIWQVSMLAISLVFSSAVVFAQTNTVAGANTAGVSGAVDGLKMILGYHENGQVKSLLRAEKAIIQENGPIYATNITSEFFTVTGVLDIVMKADDCVYDKQARTAKSENNVRLDKKGVCITGKGFEWDASQQMIYILSNVNVVISHRMVNLRPLKGKKK